MKNDNNFEDEKLNETANNEAKTEPAEEAKAEPVKEAKTEPVKEAKAEPVEEAKAEPVEEAKAEPVEEAKAEPVKKAKAEPVEEVKAPEKIDPLEKPEREFSADSIKLSFKLTKEDIITALKNVKYSNVGLGKQLIYTVLIFIVIGISIYNITLESQYFKMTYVMLGICAVVLVLVWTFPKIIVKTKAKSLMDNKTREIVVNKEGITVLGEKEFFIPLDKKLKVEEYETQYIVNISEKEIFLIPKSAIFGNDRIKIDEYLTKEYEG